MKKERIRMNSERITKGINAAPQRTLLHALGLTDEEIGIKKVAKHEDSMQNCS